jgi:hypothetical protein
MLARFLSRLSLGINSKQIVSFQDLADGLANVAKMLGDLSRKAD